MTRTPKHDQIQADQIGTNSMSAGYDEQRDITIESVDTRPSAVNRTVDEVTTTSRVAADALVAALVGIALVTVGLIAVVRAGLTPPLQEPVVSVVGFGHTALLAVLEIAIGIALLSSGAARSRGAEVFSGAMLFVGGVVGAVQTDSFTRNFALESTWAGLLAFAGAIVVLAALLLPRVTRQSTRVDRA
jgi:hypothetical protein